MNSLLLALATGIGSVALLPAIPSEGWWWLPVVAGLACCRWPRLRIPGLWLVGLGYGVLFGQGLMSSQLPYDLESEPLLLKGQVVGSVEEDEHRARFNVLIQSTQVLRTGEEVSLRRVRLSHYRPRDRELEAAWVIPATGEQWSWVVRLKRPRGFANPGGFDYQANLLRQGISGVGYVSGQALRLDQRLHSDQEASNVYVRLDRLRQRLSERISQRLGESGATLLKALLIGDQAGFTSEQWQWLRDTGTIHLVIISGLHIGMLAGVGLMIGVFIGRLLSAGGHPWPAQWWGALTALLAAIGYAALAGFSMPTQRALVTVCCGLLILLMRRQVSLWQGYCVSLVVVLLINPLVVTGAGFWLSFMAVASLLLGLQGRNDSYLRALVLTQAAVTAGLVPWLLFWIGAMPLAASLVNLPAVPWVGLVLLPMGFLVLLLDAALGWAPQWLWSMLDGALQILWLAIQHASRLDGQLLVTPSRTPLWLWMASFGGVFLVLAPLPWRIRWLGVLPLLGLVLAAQDDGPFLRLAILDVGQGLAAVVQVEDRVLVYDTGPEYSPDFNAGGGIIAPYLSYFGADQIDHLVISHRHLDHAGGAPGLLAALPVVEITSGEPEQLALGRPVAPCEPGRGWNWGAVEFSLLHVGEQLSGSSPNDQSCMVLIRAAGVSILLSGDIERQGEAALLSSGAIPEALTVLQAPHHGSNTSSTSAFLAHVRPEMVIFPRGYKHRFGHPHPRVVERVEQVGSRHYDTALQGAIVIEWNRDGRYQVTCWRDRMRGFWIDRPEC